ncbi:hypothetical protein GUJ93_ZPchr0014g46609 [Zizania palustris]|uniref:Uncharacterized protein n=1 Tax=Zizania palustris TaxID=103762 RepID=A0A8J5VVD0_ZIZPA|nr:hypothetical protein GUJ93_ZPchr0014g46609 [Zizania palustris]
MPPRLQSPASATLHADPTWPGSIRCAREARGRHVGCGGCLALEATWHAACVAWVGGRLRGVGGEALAWEARCLCVMASEDMGTESQEREAPTYGRWAQTRAQKAKRAWCGAV